MHALSLVGKLKWYITGRWTIMFSGEWSRAGLEWVAGRMRPVGHQLDNPDLTNMWKQTLLLFL